MSYFLFYLFIAGILAARTVYQEGAGKLGNGDLAGYLWLSALWPIVLVVLVICGPFLVSYKLGQRSKARRTAKEAVS